MEKVGGYLQKSCSLGHAKRKSMGRHDRAGRRTGTGRYDSLGGQGRDGTTWQAESTGRYDHFLTYASLDRQGFDESANVWLTRKSQHKNNLNYTTFIYGKAALYIAEMNQNNTFYLLL